MEQKKLSVAITLKNDAVYVYFLGKGGITGIYSKPHGIVVYTATSETVIPWGSVLVATFTREEANLHDSSVK